MENALLLLLLVAPFALLAAAVRIRRAREAALDPEARRRVSTATPWDKSFRNAALTGLTGLLLLPSGLYAFAKAAGHRWGPLFMLPVIAGVVLLFRAYRIWMRGVGQVPD
jgi:hypothetical protein